MASKKSFKAEMQAQQAQAVASYITEEAQPVEELKTKRVNLLLRPTVHERCNKIAYMSKMSFNDLVNQALEAYAEAHSDLVTKYDDTF